MLVLPPGPAESRLTQTVMLTRDPLGTLRRLRSRFGPIFTIRTTNGPLVAVSDAGELERVVESDPGSDGEAHRAASARMRPALSPAAVGAVEREMEVIAARLAGS